MSHEGLHNGYNKDIVEENSVNFVDNNFHYSFDCSTVPAHRQAGTVANNHSHSENRSHISHTSLIRTGVVEGSRKDFENH
ncbi:hypothetical protein Tco_1087793 [Tanacetum coccineum]